MELLHSLPVLKASQQTNYRIKTCVNFDGNPYDDTVTDQYLLDKINQFIKHNFQVKYAYFQKSNVYQEYGIIISKDCNLNAIAIYDMIKTDKELKVFGFYNNQDDIEYLTFETRIKNKYYDFDWYVSINGFVQPNPFIGLMIHEIVDEMIIKNPEYAFYGLGGEGGMYSYRNQYKKSLCLTNSNAIHDDYKSNKRDNKIKLIDYDKDQLTNYKIGRAHV